MSLKKKFLIGKEARDKMLEGAKIVYDLVSPTSGPKGRNIAYSRPWGLPRVINDGIEIAKEIGSEDDFVNVGIDLIREAAQNTVTGAGDGTTTSVILSYHIIEQGMKAIDNGENPMVIRNQMMEALSMLLQSIPALSTKIASEEDLRKVALISSSYDEEIAQVVAHAVWEMGVDGIVTSEEGNGTTITSEITKGMQLQKGYLDQLLITDDMRNEAVVVNPAIIIFEKVVTSQSEIVPIMNEIAKMTKNVVFFGDIRGDALQVVVVNKMRGIFNVLAVNPPGYQEQRTALLQDIATVTGAKIITAATQSFRVEDAGTASHVSANKTTTTIVGGAGNKTVVEARVGEIRKKLEKADNSLYEREKYEERLSKLTAGVALIKVGAKSETLKREKFEKVKDAIGASKAALAEGIVTGGAIAFLELEGILAKDRKGKLNQGEKVLSNALQQPFMKLLANAGKTESESKSIYTQVGGSLGFNVNTDKIEDLAKAGVIDPLRVVRLSLENAVVIATSMLTAEGLIVDAPQKNQGQQQ